MKIGEAKKIYSAHLETLRSRKQELTEILKKDAGSGIEGLNYDRVELSKELSQVDKEYDKTQSFMEQLSTRETAIQNAEVARQQGEAMSEAMEDMIKCLEIARRISEGAKVPSADQQKLLEYNHELYMAAKNMAMMNTQKDKEYDSLVEEEEDKAEDTKTPLEIANETEVSIDLPEVSSEVSPSASE